MGENKGANPGEILLHGLLACMTTAMVLLAAGKGIEVSGVSSSIEGDVDLQRFLGMDPNVPKAFSQIRVNFEIEGARDEEKEQLISFAKQSPVYNSLINPTDVQVSVH